MDLENMSDQDLRIKLASLGHNIGPISCTTRNLYEKILLKLMDEGIVIYCRFHTKYYKPAPSRHI